MIGTLAVRSPSLASSALSSAPAPTLTATGPTAALTSVLRETMNRAVGIDLRAPEPVPVAPVVKLPLATAATMGPSPAAAAQPPTPIQPSAPLPAFQPAPVVEASAPSPLPAAPSPLLSDAPAARPPALVTIPELPVLEAGAAPVQRDRAAGAAPSPLPAGTVGVRVDAPDWALYIGAALALGGVGWWLYSRRSS